MPTGPTADAYRRCKQAEEISLSFVKPFFDKAIRYYKLFRGGQLPDEWDVTFSKAFLYLAFSYVWDILPKIVGHVFSQPKFFSMEPQDRELEFFVRDAERWLYSQVYDRMNMPHSLISTLQSMAIFGNGYQYVGSILHKDERKRKAAAGSVLGFDYGEMERVESRKEWRIISQPVDFFQLLPAPNGGLINPMDKEWEGAVPWVIRVNHISRKRLEDWGQRGFAGVNKDHLGKLFETKGDDTTTVDEEYHNQMAVDRGEEGNQSFWLTRFGETKSMGAWYPVEQFFFRDREIWLANDRFVIYDAPPEHEDGTFPFAKYGDTPDLNNWFDMGWIEVVEDLILAIGLKFGLELDYLANIMFPTRFVSAQVRRANPDIDNFGPAPNKEIEVPYGVDPRQAIWYDRFPDISPQNFMEDAKLEKYLEAALGNPSVGNIMAAGQVREAATSTMALLEQTQGRIGMRGQNIEEGGLRDQLHLILLNGAEHQADDVWVRSADQDSPFWWTMIDSDAISGRYRIRLHGTRNMVSKQNALSRLLNALPLLLQDPHMDPIKLRREALRRMEIFEEPDELLAQQAPQA
ncbi:MAG: hypothetical protein ABIG68_02535, partial [Acidobacteriota bacterium]